MAVACAVAACSPAVGATPAPVEAVEPAGLGATNAGSAGPDAQFHAGEQTMGQGGSNEDETSSPGMSPMDSSTIVLYHVVELSPGVFVNRATEGHV